MILPEIRIVDKITRPNHVEPLPPMVEIWDFGRQYKQLDQQLINRLGVISISTVRNSKLNLFLRFLF